MNTTPITIGVFYDGSYFGLVSGWYAHYHPRKARVSINGLHKFIKERIAKEEDTDPRYCQIVEAHYFRGRFSATQSAEKGDDTLFRERQWDDILMKEAVTTHYLPMQMAHDGRRGVEKGIDVWLALEALELSMLKKLTHVVLVAADSDYVPLVRKLHSHSVRVGVLGWTFSYVSDGGDTRGTRASQLLMSEVSYPWQMDEIIDGKINRTEEEQATISNIFVRRREAQIEDVADTLDDGWKEGTIVNLLDGFGFIKPADGGDNLFFHHTAVQSSEFNEMFKGMEVSYQDGIGSKGSLAALKVRTYY